MKYTLREYKRRAVERTRNAIRKPGRIDVAFKERLGKYPSRAEMGPDPALWTQHDDAVGRRVWVLDRRG